MRFILLPNNSPYTANIYKSPSSHSWCNVVTSQCLAKSVIPADYYIHKTPIHSWLKLWLYFPVFWMEKSHFPHPKCDICYVFFFNSLVFYALALIYPCTLISLENLSMVQHKLGLLALVSLGDVCPRTLQPAAPKWPDLEACCTTVILGISSAFLLYWSLSVSWTSYLGLAIYSLLWMEHILRKVTFLWPFCSENILILPSLLIEIWTQNSRLEAISC